MNISCVQTPHANITQVNPNLCVCVCVCVCLILPPRPYVDCPLITQKQ